MKIALYQPWIYLHGGLEKSLLEVVTRSTHEWVVYTGHYEPENTFKEFEDVDVRVLNPTTVKRTIGGTLYSAYQAITTKIPDEDFDAIVVWCDGIGDLIAFRNHDLPLFNICSTPLRAAFDPVYEAMSVEGKGLIYKAFYQVFKYAFRWIDRKAWSYYDGIITTSTEVKSRIIAGGLCVDEARMQMAYPGIEWHVDISKVAYEPFILLPGRIMWTKNIEQGIKAFILAQLPKPWKLVVAGFVDEKSHVYLQKLKDMVPKNVTVEFVVSPSSAQLVDLYARASFCLFTPLNEDWGIVPLESMRYGKAVISNARGGPLESVIHEKTGFLHAPDDFDGWASSIRKLALNSTLCLAMGQHANFHVRNFTWRRFVRRIDISISRWAKRKKRAEKVAEKVQLKLLQKG